MQNQTFDEVIFKNLRELIQLCISSEHSERLDAHSKRLPGKLKHIKNVK